MTADVSSRPSVLRRSGTAAEKPGPEPKSDTLPDVSWDWWRAAPRIAVVGIFMLLLGAFLFFARSLIAPIVAAAVISIMFGPLAARAARYRMPPALFALGCVGLVILLANIGMILLGGVLADWAARAPELVETLRAKAGFLERPLATWRELQLSLAAVLGTSVEPIKFELPASNILTQAVNFLTPAVGELVVFFGSLFFFLLSRNSQRRHLVLMFRSQDARLRALRVLNTLEASLTRYLAVVSLINIVVGAVAAGIAYAFGLPSPALWGIAAFMLNYIPYVGPAVVALILLVLGLIALPTVPAALLAPALFVAFATIEGHFVTPALVGRQLTVSPLALFLSLAFWTWLWGPLGTFLATPILIAAVVVREHTMPSDEVVLPD
ncbi:MAG: AI-2E family transporter [Xanthobacteraceae bacterium]|nr:AI-2E family transporter [Xanthobacteraceae bacterium]